MNIDKIYLARNIAAAILNISKSLNHNVGFVFDFEITEIDNILLFKNRMSKFILKLSKPDVEQALYDRNILNFTDDNKSIFLGHSNLNNYNQCFKLSVTLDHILLSIPDKKLSDFLVNALINNINISY